MCSVRKAAWPLQHFAPAIGTILFVAASLTFLITTSVAVILVSAGLVEL
jgi:hypothetical protein